MKRLLTLLILLFPFAANASEATAVDGLWLTENERSVIKIKKCGDGLCGNIYWIIKDGMQTDVNNPDKTKRDTPMCDLSILWGFEEGEGGVWKDGNIYKADDGDLYSAKLEVLEDGTLKLRGYLGVPWLGKTQIWKRVSESDYPHC